tara:strand:- start:191 stop:313 length:123 start_codon:yes stop_codon:yes gene_type:complete
MVDINWLNQKFQMKAPNQDDDKPKTKVKQPDEEDIDWSNA